MSNQGWMMAALALALGACVVDETIEAENESRIVVSPPPPPATIVAGKVEQALHNRRNDWDKWIVVGAITPTTGEGVFYRSKNAGDTVPTSIDAFRMGSIAKTFTGTLFGLQNGTLGGMPVGNCTGEPSSLMLKDKLPLVCSGCGTLPFGRDAIHVSQLATHNSGLRKGEPLKMCSLNDIFKSVTTTANPNSIGSECTDDSGASELDLPPGNYQYSRWGMEILGALLVYDANHPVVLNQPPNLPGNPTTPPVAQSLNFAQLARQRLFTPLGMTHTFGPAEAPNFDGFTRRARAWGCASINECLERDPDDYSFPAQANQWRGPAGNFWSTGPDMFAYLRYSMGKTPRTSATSKLLDARSVIFCNQGKSGADNGDDGDDGEGYMGLGWGWDDDLQVWSKGGNGGAHGAYITYSPSRGVGVFVLTSADVPDSAKLVARELMSSL